MFNYLFVKPKNDTVVVKIPVKKVFIVLDKVSNTFLGVFDTLEAAKKNGTKITYNSCTIIESTLNDPCKYIFHTVYEN